MSRPPPHPIPYQGSKRRLAPAILACFPPDVETLVEPFAGSGAVTLAAAAAGRARRFALSDSLAPLVGIWQGILGDPDRLAAGYAALWAREQSVPDGTYEQIRDEYNTSPDPARLLYLLARCVKSAVRFNAAGGFNQSPDRRRRGARPDRVAAHLRGAAALLSGRATARVADYAEALAAAGPRDLVYMDPPYLGVSGGRDTRYHQGLDAARFAAALEAASSAGLRYLISLDGRTGGRGYGPPLPAGLGLERLELAAGRSSQATLLGRVEETVEALYLSPALSRALGWR